MLTSDHGGANDVQGDVRSDGIDGKAAVHAFANLAQTERFPIPLNRPTRLPHFPVDALPGPIAQMVDQVAEFSQTDPAMSGTSALAVISACTGGHAEIEIRPGWREPLCIYTATVASPGERKSAVQHSMSKPLFDVEHQLAEAVKGARLEAETRKDIQTRTAEKLKQTAASAANTDRDQAMADALGAAMLAESISVPAIPRLVADDITPEAAASILAEQGGRLAIISAEGGIFDIVGGRYAGNVPNMDLWLKGHAGDPLKVDRKGRPPEYIPKPAVTLGLMIQPTVLDDIAANRQFRGRGFLARILYAFPCSKVGQRRIAPPPVDANVEDSYSQVIAELAAGLTGWAGDPAVLTLTSTAQEAVKTIEAAVEPSLSGDGELAMLADWGAKYIGAVIRIAGMIHLAALGPNEGTKKPVTAETILAANRVGEYFKACAIRAFTAMGTDKVTSDAEYLLGRVRRLDKSEVSEREIFTAASRTRFKTKADMKNGLDLLIDHGYLLPLPPAEPTGGRPASPRFRVVAEPAEAA